MARNSRSSAVITLDASVIQPQVNRLEFSLHTRGWRGRSHGGERALLQGLIDRISLGAVPEYARLYVLFTQSQRDAPALPTKQFCELHAADRTRDDRREGREDRMTYGTSELAW